MTQVIRYSEALTVQVLPGFRSLIDKAALAAGSKPTEWARQALAEALREAGLDPAPRPAPSAGALYDSRIENGEAQQRFAWIDGDQIKSISYLGSKPEDGRTWLPVRHIDSEQFDPALHWRLAPSYSIQGDHVRCEYEVVPKSMEHA
jgi:hypothetical protein